MKKTWLFVALPLLAAGLAACYSLVRAQEGGCYSPPCCKKACKDSTASQGSGAGCCTSASGCCKSCKDSEAKEKKEKFLEEVMDIMGKTDNCRTVVRCLEVYVLLEPDAETAVPYLLRTAERMKVYEDDVEDGVKKDLADAFDKAIEAILEKSPYNPEKKKKTVSTSPKGCVEGCLLGAGLGALIGATPMTLPSAAYLQHPPQYMPGSN